MPITPTRSLPFEVFISYATPDTNLLNRLMTHLASLEREGLISIWHGGQIRSGKIWQKEIEDHLSSAQIILLLLSAHFIKSKFCYDVELQRAMERSDAGDAIVIPIRLRPFSLKDSRIDDLQYLPRGEKTVTQWEDEDSAFENITRHVRVEVERLRSQSRRAQIQVPAADGPIERSPKQATPDGFPEGRGPGPTATPRRRGFNRRILLLSAVIGVLLLSVAYGVTFYSTRTVPEIRFTRIPPYDPKGGDESREAIAGEVTGGRPGDWIVIYSLTEDTWHVQPTAHDWNTPIEPDGRWGAEIHTGKRYAALLVRSDFKPPDTTSDRPSHLPGVITATEVEGTR